MFVETLVEMYVKGGLAILQAKSANSPCPLPRVIQKFRMCCQNNDRASRDGHATQLLRNTMILQGFQIRVHKEQLRMLCLREIVLAEYLLSKLLPMAMALICAENDRDRFR